MKKIKIELFFVFCGLAFLFTSCQNEFEPFTENEENIMVFSILDNRLPVQYIKAQKLYQIREEKKELKNIEMYLIENNGLTIKLRDTVCENDNYRCYYAANYTLKRGIDYRLAVVEDTVLKCWSDAHVWENPLTGAYMVGYIQNEIQRYSAGFYFKRACAEYYLFKILIEYEIEREGQNRIGYSELPVEVSIFEGVKNPTLKFEEYELKDYITIYSSIQKKGDTTFHVRPLITDNSRNQVSFYGESMVYAAKAIQGESNASQVTIKRALALFYSIDEKIYEQFIKSGKEKYSVRLDEPLYWSNILSQNADGVGFFGSVTVDTIFLKVPSPLISMFGYKDGQK